MRLWAHATSPHGLGLSPEAFWRSTRRELDALQEVYEEPIRRQAMLMAILRNAHRGPGEVPWTVDDFMGRGDRQKRVYEAARGRSEAAFEEMRLAKIRPGMTEGVPAWALEAKKVN